VVVEAMRIYEGNLPDEGPRPSGLPRSEFVTLFPKGAPEIGQVNDPNTAPELEMQEAMDEDEADIILASERHPTDELPDDLPRRHGKIQTVGKDKHDRAFAVVHCDQVPRRIFVHSIEAEKAGINLELGTVISFLPVPSIAQPGQFTGIAIKEASFPLDHHDSRMVAIEKGVDLACLTFTQACPEINEALEEQTQNTRERIFRLVQDKIRTHKYLQQEQVAVACVRTMYKVKADHMWKWGTMHAGMSTLAGTMNCLDAYSKAKSVNLGKSASWRMAMRRIAKKANLEAVKQSAPATLADIKACTKILEPKRRSAKLMLVIAWAHAGRGSNVMTLTKGNFSHKGKSIRWTKAKTTATRGCYTTHSSYGEFSTFVQEELDKIEDPTQQLFTKEDLKMVREALHERNPNFDLRSLRRGALQALAAKGYSDDLLMQFSGHTTTKSLYRYLNWGEKLGARFAQGQEAAEEALWLPVATL
jgi:hypothetical protein